MDPSATGVVLRHRVIAHSLQHLELITALLAAVSVHGH
jgi:hypothetical protein